MDLFWLSVITGVSPTEGSVSGGTLITIYGMNFNTTANHVEVFVGGTYVKQS